LAVFRASNILANSNFPLIAALYFMDSMKKGIVLGVIITIVFISGGLCGKYLFKDSLTYKQQKAYELLAFKNAEYYGFITLSLDKLQKGNGDILIKVFEAKQAELKEIVQSNQNDPELAHDVKKLIEVPLKVADSSVAK